jgi:endonuclease YncB( thermonuclease family)
MKTNFLRMLLAILILTFPSLGQISSGGEVVEVVDGRTIVVATANGRVKVELQCIEIPEPGQQLYETVNDHLRKLLAGRIVEYKPKMILPDRVIGRVHLNNLDVSQQMLRDGAAWHLPKKISGQDKAEFDAYASIETAARAEKRGVWSIPGLSHLPRGKWKMKKGSVGSKLRNRPGRFLSVLASFRQTLEAGHQRDDSVRPQAAWNSMHG